MTRCAIIAILLLVPNVDGQSRNAPSNTVVHVAAWTTTGERIERIWVVASSVDGREKYSGNGRDVNLSMPTGEYILNVEAPGFARQRELFTAYRPAVLRTVALPVAWIHGQTTTKIKGVLRNYDGNMGDLRVRLVGLYGSDVRDSAIETNGSFSFPADAGSYLLLLVADVKGGAVIIHSEPIRVAGDENILIDLKEQRRAVMP